MCSRRKSSLPNATVMFHQPSRRADRQATDIAIQAKEKLKVRERLNAIYKKNRRYDIKRIEKCMEVIQSKAVELGSDAVVKSRFKANDIKGALRLAQKAQRFFPTLQNVQQTIAAYEVHLEASKSGPTDWHAVLQVKPSADYSTIKKQYRKMCLLTHPDKNPGSSAADGAFKLVTKAWSILSTSKSSTSKEKKAQNWEHMFTIIKCQKCVDLQYWNFRRIDNKWLYHQCNECSIWGVIRRTSAKADVPLNCGGCDRNLSWGKYRPSGYECSNCGRYDVVGVDPNWIPKSQEKDTSFRPDTVSCPFCGAWSNYKIDGSNKCYVTCKQCGLRSIIQLEKA